jgi:carbohydrate kinase (thermoresistant glucokinase family)
MLYIVMGVSGTGKSTIGGLLAERLDIPFYDADDLHPEVNRIKMQSGIPLDDQDRAPWLHAVHDLALRLLRQHGGVIACSALKAKYREALKESIADRCIWIFLQGDMDLVRKRLEQRSSHFMSATLLESQFATLEVPEDAIRVSIVDNPERIIAHIMDLLSP